MMHYYNVYQSHKLFATNVPRLTSWANKEIIMWWIEPILHWRSVFIDLAGVVPGRVTGVSWPSSNDHWWTSQLHSGRPEKQGCFFSFPLLSQSLSGFTTKQWADANTMFRWFVLLEIIVLHLTIAVNLSRTCFAIRNRHVNLSGLAINIILWSFAKYRH